MRIFTELTTECDITTQLYASGYEKKEIADMKCRAVSTINNQLQRAFEVLGVRNGRELSLKLTERLSGIDFSAAMRTSVACCLILLLSIDSHFEVYRQRVRSRSKIEHVARVRSRSRGRNILI